MKKFLFPLIFASCVPMMAQAIECAPRGLVVGVLKEKYNESVDTMGVTPQGVIVEMWVSEAAGTWSLVVTTDGQSCLLLAGAGLVRG